MGKVTTEEGKREGERESQERGCQAVAEVEADAGGVGKHLIAD